ncbi:MAG: hypothetical protein HYZ16_11620 [Bacteroidetes bacterium]|nr:hypothetical protein [Bacteroidota bacterium]
MKPFILIAATAISLFFHACEQEEMASKRFFGRDGVWLIEEIKTTTYDTLGNVLKDSSILSPGELIFFNTQPYKGQSGYHQGVCLVYSLGQGNPLEYYMDNYRAHITALQPSDTLGIGRVWTIEENKKRTQVWTHVQMHPNGETLPFSLAVKTVLRLKSINAF